ncbi:MAG: 16S rRNA (guanine(527)-N(7))-methyltransferase RsmG [Elusimicrobiota bacterium]|nr:16S rRNA (guanine(527)-N(7))-methyltransferase RsmG [Elusimicrobiota bacterium]MDH5662013.1 16S rRNA (guanine(527)-N(7))-methyltransferase RsmG [Elusimicrobiota bacterium]
MDGLATSFQTRAKQAGVELACDQVEKFLLFLRELKRWNKKFNLTAINDEEEILVKHFIDSLSCLLGVPSKIYQKIRKIIDIGSGAGFPGIPLKIYEPKFDLTLLEATRKKVEFLQHISRKLGFERSLEVIHGRAEEYGRNGEYREKYDLAVSRAVSDLAILAEYCLPFVKIGGIFISQKGRDIAGELQKAGKAIVVLGGRIKKVVPYKLTLKERKLERTLVVVDKAERTPDDYPRRPGVVAKRPIR